MSVVSIAAPPPEPDSSTEQSSCLPRWLWVLAGLIGLSLVGLGLALGALPFLFPVVFEGAAVITAGFGLIAVTLGSALVVAGIQGWRQVSPQKYYSRRSWLVFLLASAIVALIALLLPAGIHSSPLFAPFHFALIMLPALFLFSVITLLSGPAAAVALRRLTLAAAGGAATIFLAVPLELIGLFVSAVISVIVVSAVPGGAEEIERLLALLQGWSAQPPSDEAELLSLLASPVVLLVLALLLAVITPLVEEFGKTLVLGVMGIWVKPTVLVGFIWGVACGLGFAWLEGISNGAFGLGGTASWLGGVGARFFATAMHALTSGFVGIGWAYLWRGKWWVLPLTYAVAVVFHGLWNLNLVLSLGGIGTTVSSSPLGGSIAVLGVGIQILLITVSLATLLIIPVVLRRRGEAAPPRAS